MRARNPQCVISENLQKTGFLKHFEEDLEYCSSNAGHGSGVGVQDEPKDVSNRHHTTTMHQHHHHTLSTEFTNMMAHL